MTLVRGAVGMLAGTAALLAWAVPAGAYVSVSPTEANRGTTADFVLSVPNESRTAATVRLDVEVPEGLTTTVPTAPVGWTVTVTGRVVSWTGGRIEVGARTDFPLRIGPLASGDRLLLPAVQSYSDGTVVRWIQPPAGSGSDHGAGAERPAPAVTLVGTPPSTTTTTTAPTSTVADDDKPAPGTTASAAEDTGGDDGSAASWVVGAGALAAVAVVTGLVLVRRRSRADS